MVASDEENNLSDFGSDESESAFEEYEDESSNNVLQENETQKKLTKHISDIRSLLASAPCGELTITELVSDFKTLCSGDLAHIVREFGYKSTLEFMQYLKTENVLTLKNETGIWKVRVRATSDLAKIVSLVARTKPKIKKCGKFKNKARGFAVHNRKVASVASPQYSSQPVRSGANQHKNRFSRNKFCSIYNRFTEQQPVSAAASVLLSNNNRRGNKQPQQYQRQRRKKCFSENGQERKLTALNVDVNRGQQQQFKVFSSPTLSAMSMLMRMTSPSELGLTTAHVPDKQPSKHAFLRTNLDIIAERNLQNSPPVLSFSANSSSANTSTSQLLFNSSNSQFTATTVGSHSPCYEYSSSSDNMSDCSVQEINDFPDTLAVHVPKTDDCAFTTEPLTSFEHSFSGGRFKIPSQSPRVNAVLPRWEMPQIPSLPPGPVLDNNSFTLPRNVAQGCREVALQTSIINRPKSLPAENAMKSVQENFFNEFQSTSSNVRSSLPNTSSDQAQAITSNAEGAGTAASSWATWRTRHTPEPNTNRKLSVEALRMVRNSLPPPYKSCLPKPQPLPHKPTHKLSAETVEFIPLNRPQCVAQFQPVVATPIFKPDPTARKNGFVGFSIVAKPVPSKAEQLKKAAELTAAAAATAVTTGASCSATNSVSFYASTSQQGQQLTPKPSQQAQLASTPQQLSQAVSEQSNSNSNNQKTSSKRHMTPFADLEHVQWLPQRSNNSTGGSGSGSTSSDDDMEDGEDFPSLWPFEPVIGPGNTKQLQRNQIVPPDFLRRRIAFLLLRNVLGYSMTDMHKAYTSRFGNNLSAARYCKCTNEELFQALSGDILIMDTVGNQNWIWASDRLRQSFGQAYLVPGASTSNTTSKKSGFTVVSIKPKSTPNGSSYAQPMLMQQSRSFAGFPQQQPQHCAVNNKPENAPQPKLVPVTGFANNQFSGGLSQVKQTNPSGQPSTSAPENTSHASVSFTASVSNNPVSVQHETSSASYHACFPSQQVPEPVSAFNIATVQQLAPSINVATPAVAPLPPWAPAFPNLHLGPMPLLRHPVVLPGVSTPASFLVVQTVCAFDLDPSSNAYGIMPFPTSFTFAEPDNRSGVIPQLIVPLDVLRERAEFQPSVFEPHPAPTMISCRLYDFPSDLFVLQKISELLRRFPNGVLLNQIGPLLQGIGCSVTFEPLARLHDLLLRHPQSFFVGLKPETSELIVLLASSVTFIQPEMSQHNDLSSWSASSSHPTPSQVSYVTSHETLPNNNKVPVNSMHNNRIIDDDDDLIDALAHIDI